MQCKDAYAYLYSTKEQKLSKFKDGEFETEFVSLSHNGEIDNFAKKD